MLRIIYQPTNLLDNCLPMNIRDLFEECDQPIPISIDYPEDEIELKATINGGMVEVRNAGHKGLGLFAQTRMSSGFKLYYIGEVTSTPLGIHADSDYIMEMLPGSTGQPQ